MVVEKYTKPIYLDWHQRLIEVTNNEGSIELSTLLKEYPEFADVPSSTLWYHMNSLAGNGYIRLERQPRFVILHSVEL